MLLTVERVMARLGMAPDLLAQATVVLTDAIGAAQTKLETTVESRLGLGTGIDVFDLDPSFFSGMQPGGVFRLLLTNGFIVSVESVEYSDTWNMLSPQVMDESLWALDAARGFIMVDKSYQNKFVRVNYTSGFENTEDLLVRAPWLDEAMLALVPLVLDAGRSKGSDDQSGNANAWASGGSFSEGLTGNYTRKIGFTLRPMRSEWALTVAP